MLCIGLLIARCQTFISEFDKLLERQKSRALIVGDVNLDLLKNASAIIDYKNSVESNGYQIQNTISPENATRTTTNTASILDHIITNKNIVCNLTLADHSISDHKIIDIEMKKMEFNKEKEIFKKAYVNTEAWLHSVNLRHEQEDIETFEQLANIITETKKEHTSEKILKIQAKNYWINETYIKMLKQRDKSYIRWKRIQNDHTEKEFKQARNKLNNMRRSLQKKYAEKQIQETNGDHKKIWKVLNNLCGKSGNKSKIHRIVAADGRKLESDAELAHEFNRHFSNIGCTLASSIKQNPHGHFEEQSINESVFLKPTDINEIKEIITTLKNNCAPGMDKVTKSDLLKVYHIIGEKLVNMTNKVLETGIYPQELKTAKVIPLHKKGAQDELNNYRPISLLNTFSKILEKVIKNRLISFIQGSFKFDNRQYGFQKNSSTLGTTVDLLEYVSNEIDKNKIAVLVFIDLQKAFDTVNIDILLNKLYKMGCRGITYKLLETYSKNREQYTVVNGEASSKAGVQVGVAQGSVLGPLQYLLYVHSIKFIGLKANYFMFADDTVLVYTSENSQLLEDTVNEDLKLYYDWLCYNKLSINIEKTVYMTVTQKGKKANQHTIKINNTALKKVNEYKYLGLLITSKLSWETHIESVIQKIVPFIGAVKRCAHQLNKNTRYLLYNSFIEPHLRYLIPCWGNTSEYLLNKLQRTQNKAIKAIFSLVWSTPSEQLYQQFPFLNIRQLKYLEQSKLIYYMRNNLIKTNVTLRETNEYHIHNTRTNTNIRNNHARTKKGQDSPIYRSVQTFNKVPKANFMGSQQKICCNLKKCIKNSF